MLKSLYWSKVAHPKMNKNDGRYLIKLTGENEITYEHTLLSFQKQFASTVTVFILV